MNACIVIPAYKPDAGLITYITELRRLLPAPVIVVDDGSPEECGFIFSQIRRLTGCHVLAHPQNRGKGAAIKTAITFYLNHIRGCLGIITADCDGQHQAGDVAKIAGMMVSRPDALILGCRHFGPDTPGRSLVGNRLISAAMRFMYSIDLEDTQTGLRGLPNHLLPGLAHLSGSRYEYELNVLIHARRVNTAFVTVPITTLYFDDNQGSHYHPIRDSLRITGQLLRGFVQYGLASALSAGVDILTYTLLMKLAFTGLPFTESLFAATAIARLLSSLINYSCNRHLPGSQNKKLMPTLTRYYILCFFQFLASFGLVWTICTLGHFDSIAVKIGVDGFLAVLSYQVQLRWVFKSPAKKTPQKTLKGHQSL